MNGRWVLAGVIGVVLMAAAGIGGGLLGASLADDESTNDTVNTSASDLAAILPGVRSSVVAVETVGPQGAGLGTGVVIDEDGHVLTNFHVVNGAQTVSVQFEDGQSFEANIVGTDSGSDLAVLSIDAPGDRLEPATFASEGSIKVGEPVFAIGNPFGLDFTVTEGIISAISRNSLSSPLGRPIPDAIQTDAAINPGNSGGPLFDMEGNVVGINTALENPTGESVFVGIGFAIPASRVQRFLPEMLAGNNVQHPQLGISGIGLDQQLAEQLGVAVDHGVYVVDVAPGSAAAAAGLQGARSGTGQLPTGGEVITALDGNDVATVAGLLTAIDQHAVGDEVELRVVEDGESRTLSVTLQAWDAAT